MYITIHTRYIVITCHALLEMFIRFRIFVMQPHGSYRLLTVTLYEPCHEKTKVLHMRKQRRRSASR